jgi:hypothetical protein
MCTIFSVSLYNCCCFLHNSYNVVHNIVHKERACLACAAAPAPSRACLCSMHQRVLRLTIIMQITSSLCGARQAHAPARQRSQLERLRASAPSWSAGVPALPARAPACQPSAPALTRRNRNRGRVLGQNCFFIFGLLLPVISRWMILLN